MQRFLLISLVCLCFVGGLHANPGDVDLSFDPGSGINGSVSSVVAQSDGKIIIGGTFSTVRGAVRNFIARLNQDGTADSTFNTGTGPDEPVTCIALQSNGKILVAGTFTNFNGTERDLLARLNPDGTLDTTFTPSSWVGYAATCLAVQADGKILVGVGYGFPGILRLKPDGSLDNTFYPFNTFDSYVSAVAVQTDGKVLIAGDFSYINDTVRNHIARLDASGNLDDSFQFGTGPNFGINSVTLQTNGKLVIGGYFASVNGTTRNNIARLNVDGSLDTAFTTGTDFAVRTVAQQTDGKLIVGGDFTAVNGVSRPGVARLQPDGILDTTFDPATGASNHVNAVCVQANGKVLVGSESSILGYSKWKGLIRLNTNGTPDSAFQSYTGIDGPVNSVAMQRDGKALISGAFASINGTNRNRIARLNVDGTLDTTFNPGSGPGGVPSAYDPSGSYRIDCVASQSDGKALVGGYFNLFQGTNRNALARLNTDGSLDNAFHPAPSEYAEIVSVAVQTDGKIVLGGFFNSINGTSRTNIARLNADGSLDNTFNPGSGATEGGVFCLAVQSDGKVLLGGDFSGVNGVLRRCVARLNADGSLDSTFNPGSGTVNNSVYSLAPQADGKVLIGGAFSKFNGTTNWHIARLNNDGSLDTTFHPGTGTDFNGYVFSIIVQPNGKVLIGGDLRLFNGTPRNGVARLNQDGSLDTVFDPGMGAKNGIYNRVNSLALRPNGTVLIGGDFTIFNGVARTYAVQLWGDPLLYIRKTGNTAVLSWTNAPAFSLQSAPSLTGSYTTLPSATSPYTNLTSGSQKFFRLKAN
ncbi:delta-60 repeat domain-containing protein [Pedosphaera parvula]|uniref:Delta-60 repeat protein n=1 Tax=Pedosphaera parvula (strain Ellin514) TaxID=320771 RepID=B9XR98_PEDPL|nr:delta-60 repeat domain-containing protein [Pedosphaera parvula]EEF57641.1 conserved hypothetical protein [Pedosphaera parvula Ellin514]